MTSNRKLHKQPQKWMTLLMLGVAMFWVAAIYTGFRLPYLYTQFSSFVRAVILFPLLFCFGIYFSFFFKKGQQQTGYMQVISFLASRKEKIKATVFGVLGLILITGGFSWTSAAFSAWAAKLFAREPYVQGFQIVGINAHGGAVWGTYFDLELRNPASDEVKVFRLNRTLFDVFRWEIGDHICLGGRSSIFGTAIDYQTRIDGRSMGSDTVLSVKPRKRQLQIKCAPSL